MTQQKRDTYKYWFKIGNIKAHCGKTVDLQAREIQHQNSGKYETRNGNRHYWKNGHIEQVGRITTDEAATQWKRENNCNENWN